MAPFPFPLLLWTLHIAVTQWWFLKFFSVTDIIFYYLKKLAVVTHHLKTMKADLDSWPRAPLAEPWHLLSSLSHIRLYRDPMHCSTPGFPWHWEPWYCIMSALYHTEGIKVSWASSQWASTPFSQEDKSSSVFTKIPSLPKPGVEPGTFKIFSLTLSQLSYFSHLKKKGQRPFLFNV